MKPTRNKLIVALDVDTLTEAHRLIDQLRGVVGMFKVGSQLFTAVGPELIRQIVAHDEQVFLDLKFHDIPNTVARAAVEATRLGVSILNVHAAGGTEMMRTTMDAVVEAATTNGIERPAVIAVTVLTSSNEETLHETGVAGDAGDLVKRLALLAANAGLDGVVASPREISLIRTAVKKPEFLIVTPGIRPAGASNDDQKRIATPRDAIKAGADYIVVGRPILNAQDIARAAQNIVDEMNRVAVDVV